MLPCVRFCGFEKEMNRLHMTCLYCRHRRYQYSRDKSHWRINSRIKGIVIPADARVLTVCKDIYEDRIVLNFATPSGVPSARIMRHVLVGNKPVYTIWVDNKRAFGKLKDVLLERLLPHVEALTNRDGLPRWKQRYLKLLYTLMECLAN